MPLPKRAARARSADTAVRRTKHIFAKSIPCRRQKSKSFFHNPRFFAARPVVFPTRPRIAPRRKGICTLFAPFFPPASFPLPFHPPPHRTAAKRRSLDFRIVFPARIFLIVFPTHPHTAPRRKGVHLIFAPFFSPASFPSPFPPAPAPHRDEKAFARFSHRFSHPRLSHRPSHPAFFSFFGKSLDKGEKTCYNNSADYQTTVCCTSRRSTQEVEEAPLLRV